MSETTLLAEVSGGSLRVRVAGPPEGTRMLFLHGGPGLSDSYLDELIAEFSDTDRVATYSQRGVQPSEAAEPFDLPVQVADVTAVLDALGWPEAIVVGHSWGAHLLLHLLAARTSRLRAAVAIETLGAVGDGQSEAFGEELLRRLSPEARARSEQPDLPDDEQFAVIWPGYFPLDTPVPVLRPVAAYPETNAAVTEAMFDALPLLAGRLNGVTTPTLFITGIGSPMPEAAAAETAALLAGPVVINRVPGGHFPWLVSPGAVRAAVDEFLSALP